MVDSGFVSYFKKSIVVLFLAVTELRLYNNYNYTIYKFLVMHIYLSLHCIISKVGNSNSCCFPFCANFEKSASI